MMDLAACAAELAANDESCITRLKAKVLASEVLIVACPTYKSSFTGLLKLFLDQFERGELQQKLTVPMMTGASPAHSLTVEFHLRPVLIEIGASCPTRGIYLSDSDIDHPADALNAWWKESNKAIARTYQCG